MKKLFLLLAFTGIVAASSASTIASFTKATITIMDGDDKKGDDKKKKCDKDKACCKAKAGEASTAKACSGEKSEMRSCCKAKAAASGASTTTTTETATEKK